MSKQSRRLTLKNRTHRRIGISRTIIRQHRRHINRHVNRLQRPHIQAKTISSSRINLPIRFDRHHQRQIIRFNHTTQRFNRSQHQRIRPLTHRGNTTIFRVTHGTTLPRIRIRHTRPRTLAGRHHHRIRQNHKLTQPPLFITSGSSIHRSSLLTNRELTTKTTRIATTI